MSNTLNQGISDEKFQSEMATQKADEQTAGDYFHRILNTYRDVVDIIERNDIEGLVEVIANIGFYDNAQEWVYYRSRFDESVTGRTILGRDIPDWIIDRLRITQGRVETIQDGAFTTSPYPGPATIQHYEQLDESLRRPIRERYEKLRRANPDEYRDLLGGNEVTPSKITTLLLLKKVLMRLSARQIIEDNEEDCVIYQARRAVAQHILGTPEIRDGLISAYEELVKALVELGKYFGFSIEDDRQSVAVAS